ncbi:MAG: chain-length determining protein [Prevotella sp.]|nr:chain-length determining protein [Prevotella sp.]
MEGHRKKKIIIDYFGLMRAIKNDKWMMAVFLILAAILGLAVSFGTPKEYKASVMLAPETATSNSLTSNISSLASMVGMNMDFTKSNDAIYPEIYPDLIQSSDFIVNLFPVKVTNKDGSVTTDYFDYLKNHTRRAWYTAPANWLKKLVEMIKKDDGFYSTDSTKVNPFRLTRDQYDIAHNISKNIDCTVDKKTSVISIEVTDQDPVVSATMADSVRERLQAFITQYRTQKARNDLAYMEKLFLEAKEQYVKARQQYAAYSDANQELMLQAFKTKQDDLENDMQLKYNAYTQVYEQLQLSKAKVQENTPAFTVVQSASVPVKHTNKSKLVMMLLFMFLGAALRVIILMWQKRRQVFILE